MIFNLEVNKRGIVNLSIIPILIKGGQPMVAEGKEKEEIIHILNQRSKAWNTHILSDGSIVGNIEYIKDEEVDSNTSDMIENKDVVKRKGEEPIGTINSLWNALANQFLEGIRKAANTISTFF
jgi:hypothetical protein